MLLEKFLNETFSRSKYVKEIGGEERPFSGNTISADNLWAVMGFMVRGRDRKLKNRGDFERNI